MHVAGIYRTHFEGIRTRSTCILFIRTPIHGCQNTVLCRRFPLSGPLTWPNTCQNQQNTDCRTGSLDDLYWRLSIAVSSSLSQKYYFKQGPLCSEERQIKVCASIYILLVSGWADILWLPGHTTNGIDIGFPKRCESGGKPYNSLTHYICPSHRSCSSDWQVNISVAIELISH